MGWSWRPGIRIRTRWIPRRCTAIGWRRLHTRVRSWRSRWRPIGVIGRSIVTIRRVASRHPLLRMLRSRRSRWASRPRRRIMLRPLTFSTRWAHTLWWRGRMLTSRWPRWASGWWSIIPPAVMLLLPRITGWNVILTTVTRIIIWRILPGSTLRHPHTIVTSWWRLTARRVRPHIVWGSGRAALVVVHHVGRWTHGWMMWRVISRRSTPGRSTRWSPNRWRWTSLRRSGRRRCSRGHFRLFWGWWRLISAGGSRWHLLLLRRTSLWDRGRYSWWHGPWGGRSGRRRGRPHSWCRSFGIVCIIGLFGGRFWRLQNQIR